MGRVNFSRGKERVDRRETVLTYHQRLKDFREVIKRLCPTLDKELNRVFTPVLIIAFRGSHKLNTLGVLIFAGTNFREFFAPYIRGYLFSRISFYSTFAGTNFPEWVVSIANVLGKYVDE